MAFISRLTLHKTHPFAFCASDALPIYNRGCASKVATREKDDFNSTHTLEKIAVHKDLRDTHGNEGRTKDSVSEISNASGEIKPFSAIPGPRGLPVFGSLFDMLRMVDKWHVLHDQRFQKYGPIWREPLPQLGNLVMIASVRGAQDVARNEGTMPTRIQLPIWLEYYKAAGQSLGLLQSDGEKWRKMRQVVDKPILRPQNIAKHVPRMEAVANDFVERLEKLRDKDGNFDRIDLELFKYSLETAGVVLYDRRFGCLLDQPPPMTTAFINSVRDMFQLSGELMLHSPYVVRMLKRKTWKKYQECWDNIFKLATDAIDQKIEASETSESDTFIGYILSRDAMTRQELYSSVTEIMLASVDTTSNTLHAAMYEIAKRPDIQDKIYTEVTQELPPGTEITYDLLDKLPYLKGVIKDVLRLYPIVYGVSRKVDKDQVISGYQIPKGSLVSVALYMVGRNPDTYENPTELKPERWMRGDDKTQRVDPFAWIPFGFGGRSCVGKRIATVEMQLLISKVVSRYKLSTNTTDFPINSRVLLMPAKPAHIKLIPRVQ